MATQDPGENITMVPTLGVTDVTMNALALMAPGAFLWMTYQLQAPASSALNRWFAVFLATALALMRAVASARLAKRSPQADAGSSSFFARAALLHQEERRPFQDARVSKFMVGWALHLSSWISAGVMVALRSPTCRL